MRLKKLHALSLLGLSFSLLVTGCSFADEQENNEPAVVVSLSGISISKLPNKLSYLIGEQLDLTGIVVSASYSDGSSKDVSSLVTGSADLSSAGAKTVTVTFSENGVSSSTSFAITVVNPTYVVSFNANGGEGTMSSVGEIKGVYTLPSNGFTAIEDYEFAGWKVNNEGNLLQPGASIDVNENVTLFAQWKEIEYNFSYDYFDHYYGELSWTNSADLMSKLHNIIRNDVTFLKYGGNWESNQHADQDLYNHDCVDMVYSREPILKTDTYYNGAGWQREHAFAASLMTGYQTGDATNTKGRATDFHNLFASFYSGNSSRGNKNFGIADKSLPSYRNYDDYSYDDYNFEPSDYDKGRLARAIFYMGVMYSQNEETASTYQPLRIVEDYVTYSEGNCQYSIGNLSTLIDWSKKNKIDYLEYQHNESVYSHLVSVDGNKKQGNRNPFVDYPGLVDYVYGSKKDQPGNLTKVKPSNEILNVNQTGTMHYAVENVQTEFVVGDTFDSTCYDLIAVDHKLNETMASASADLTESYTFTEADLATGHKEVTVKTPINEIKINVSVSNETLSNCAYYYEYNNNEDKPLANFETNTPQTANLNGQSWVFTPASNGFQVAKNQKFGLMMGNTTNNANNLEMESVTSFENIETIMFKLNANATDKIMRITLSVGEEVIKSFNVEYNSERSELYITHLQTPKSGKIKVKFSNLTGAFYFGGVGVDY